MDSLYIFFFVCAAVSFALSVFVTGNIIKFGSSTPSTRLVLYLHITLLLEDISTLPFAYNGNAPICKIMGWIHVYSGLANIMVVGLIILLYRYFFIEDTYNFTEKINKYSEGLIFIFPLITLLPFISDAYGDDSKNTWCGLPIVDEESNIWIFTVFYGWVAAIIAVSVVLFLNTFITVYKSDPIMARKLFNSIGLYAVITIISWIPRGISKLSTENFRLDNFWGYLAIYLSGFCYFFIFLTERKALKMLEAANQEKERQSRMSGSWDFDNERYSESAFTPRNSETVMGGNVPFQFPHPKDRNVRRTNSNNTVGSDASSGVSSFLSREQMFSIDSTGTAGTKDTNKTTNSTANNTTNNISNNRHSISDHNSNSLITNTNTQSNTTRNSAPHRTSLERSNSNSSISRLSSTDIVVPAVNTIKNPIISSSLISSKYITGSLEEGNSSSLKVPMNL